MMFFLSSSLVVALAAYANAAAIPKSIFKSSSISLTCQNSILALVSSPVSTCLNLNALIPIAVAPASSPLIPPITSFNTGLCAAPECTEADIESTFSELAQSCSTELEAWNLDAAQAVALAQKLIPAVKKTLCLEDSTATPPSTFCLTTFLNTVEEALLAPEKLTKENAKKAFSLIREGDPATTPGLQKVIDLKCSECGKKAEKIIQEALTSAPGTSAVKKLEKKFKKFGSSTCDGPAPPEPSGTEPPTPSGTDAPSPPKPTSTDTPAPGGKSPGDKDGDGWPDAPDEDVPNPSGPEPPTPSGTEPPTPTASEPPSAPEPSATGPTTPSPGDPEEPPSDEPPADDSLTRRSTGTAQYIFKRLLGLLW